MTWFKILVSNAAHRVFLLATWSTDVYEVVQSHRPWEQQKHTTSASFPRCGLLFYVLRIKYTELFHQTLDFLCWKIVQHFAWHREKAAEYNQTPQWILLCISWLRRRPPFSSVFVSGVIDRWGKRLPLSNNLQFTQLNSFFLNFGIAWKATLPAFEAIELWRGHYQLHELGQLTQLSIFTSSYYQISYWHSCA